MSHTGCIPGNMLSHLPDSGKFTFQFYLPSGMAKYHFPDFFWIRFFQKFSCLKIMIHLPEDPWIPSYSSSDHNTVTTGIFHHFFRFQRRIYISISNHRNRNCIFDPAYYFPVGFPCIILLPGPCHGQPLLLLLRLQ